GRSSWRASPPASSGPSSSCPSCSASVKLTASRTSEAPRTGAPRPPPAGQGCPCATSGNFEPTGGRVMSSSHEPGLGWLKDNYGSLVNELKALVRVQSVSTDGEHQKEIADCAALTCEQMKRAGLQNVEVLRTGKSNPYAYGEWLGAPGKPTVFLYAHHDVQPVHQKDVEEGRWKSPPWELTPRDGRLVGRGSAADKGAITAQLAAVSAFLKTQRRLPVNVKVLVEGEEEVGSSNLMGFFEQHKKRIASDVIVVCDTENVETGLPS